MTDEEASEPARNVEPSDDDQTYWHADMADSGSHWKTLERRRNQRRYPEAED